MDNLVTYQDAYLALFDQFNLSDTRSGRVARRAIQAANRDFPQAHKWSYYSRRYQFESSAPYSTGTVTYTHSTRTLTISGGTWPSDVADGRIRIVGQERIYYPVESASGSDLVLPVDYNPGEDVAASSFEWIRDQYPLPIDFHEMSLLIDTNSRFQLSQDSPAAAHAQQIYYNTTDMPTSYAIDADFRYLGARQCRLIQAPGTSRAYEASYRARARPLVTQQVASTGTITSGTTTLTLGSAVAKGTHVGAVVRFSDSATAPTGYEGTNPYVEYRVISSVTNSTTLELDAAITNSYAATAVEISDPVDILTSTMWEAFKACVSWKYCMADRTQAKAKKAAYEEYQAAMREAMAADWPSDGSSPAPSWSPWQLYRWSTVPSEEIVAPS